MGRGLGINKTEVMDFYGSWEWGKKKNNCCLKNWAGVPQLGPYHGQSERQIPFVYQVIV